MADKKLIEHALGILAKSAPRKVVTDPAERAANLKNFLGPTPEEIATSKWYHGTAREVPNFTNDKPTFVTTDPRFANRFAEYKTTNHAWDEAAQKWVPTETPNFAPNVMPLHVRAENPWDHTNPDHVQAVLDRLYEYRPLETNSDRMRLMHGDWENIEMPYIQREIKGLGHDAFFVNEGGERNLAVYNPANQLKSATGNAGTFDPDIPRLEENRGGNVEGYGEGGLVKKALDFLRAHPEFKPYKAGSLAPRDAIYNPKFFDLKKDNLVDEAGNVIASKDVTIPRESFSYDLPAQADPGKIFRGMSAEEFANFQKNSYLQSLGTHNIGEGQRGLTYFSVNPDEARSYAHSFAPSEFKPDPSRPAYVVATKRPPDESIVHVPGTGESEVGVRGQIPRDDVTNVYRGNVVDYIEGVNEPGAKVSPQSSVHWEEINDYARGGHIDAALHAVRRHFDGTDGSYVDPEEPRPLTIYRGNAPVADEAGGSGREPTPAPPAFSYMPTPESVARQAARQPAYDPAEGRWSSAASTEGERLTRALGVEGELPKGETTMSAAPTGWDKYMPQRRPGSYMKRWGEAFNENADAVEEGLKAVRSGNYGSGALGMAGGALGMALSPLTGMERVLVRDPILQYTGDLKKAQEAEMVADTALTGGVRGMVTPFAKAGSLERMATEPWNRVRMPSPGAAGAATAAGATLAPEDAEASKLSKAMEVARMAVPRELSPLGLYSHGAEAARGLAQAKGTPQQFASMLDKAGVRGPEMESYLKTFGGRPIVTQEEIAKHFQETMPQITERVSGGVRTPMSDEAFKANLDDLYDKFIVSTNRHPYSDAELREWAETQTDSPTRFGQYALPGGENYREVRLTLPTKNTVAPLSADELREFENIRSLGTNQMGPNERARYYELLGRDAEYRKGKETSGDFRSQHWNDPNVVAHLRMSDRTGPNGEKILHVEEIQSDWAQKGREIRDDEVKRLMKEQSLTKEEASKLVPLDYGFTDPKAFENWQNTVAKANTVATDARQAHHALVDRLRSEMPPLEPFRPGKESPLAYERRELEHHAMTSDALRANPEFQASSQRMIDTNDAVRDLWSKRPPENGVPVGPYVGNTNQWTDLALKRAFKEAAEGGYDRVVFTPGAEQAKRYSLSNQVNSIDYMKEGNDAYRLGIVDKKGESVDLPQDVFTEKELEQYLGKDVAAKIINDEGKSYRGRNHKSIEGLDLTVGGKGMLGYYDKIVPKRLQELIKKHDPSAKIGRDYVNTLPPGESWPYSAQIENEGGQYWVAGRHPKQEGIVELSPRFGSFGEADKARDLIYRGYTQPVHAIDITPAMRESILKGQSAYAGGGEVVDHALHAVRRHFAGDEGSYVDPMGPKEDPGIVDRAMSFLSKFNPIGSAEAGPLKEVAKKAAVAAPAISKGAAKAGNISLDEATNIVRRYDPDPTKDPRFYHDISSNKLSRPIDEMEAKYRRVGKPTVVPVRDPSAYEGTGFISAFGDPSIGGVKLLSVNGTPLVTPTLMQAGPAFMHGAAAQGPDKAIWASDRNVVSALQNKARKVQEAGFNPYLNYVKMGGQSPDYSHHVTDPLLDLYRQSSVPQEAVEKFDTKMRTGFHKDFPAYSGWPGLNSPDLESFLFGPRTGKSRTAMAKLMAMGESQKAGMPDVAAVRYAATDPSLLNAMNYSSGRMISRMDPFADVILNPKVPHKTYSTQLAAHPEGANVARFAHDVPLEIAYKNWYDNLMAEKPGLPHSNMLYTHVRQAPVLYWDAPTVDRVSKFLEYKDRGLIP